MRMNQRNKMPGLVRKHGIQWSGSPRSNQVSGYMSPSFLSWRPISLALTCPSLLGGIGSPSSSTQESTAMFLA